MNAVAKLALPAAVAARFVKNDDGTVTDLLLDLQRSPTLTTECVTHADAEKACAECRVGDHTDWRLPTIEELFLLADRSKHNPAIDTEAFPDTKSDWYWSSTIHAADSDYAWIVSFRDGVASYDYRGDGDAFVRAVRSVAPGQ